MSVRKGSIVWYYDKKLKEWRRGKVTCVNRYCVMVKPNHEKESIYFRYDEPVLPASLEKPDCDLETYRKRRWTIYNYKTDKRFRFLRRLGFA